MDPELDMTIWMLFLGVVFTAVARPALTRLYLYIRNIQRLNFVMNKVTPVSKEDADQLGIKSPLDYCIYMAAHQIASVRFVDDNETYYAVTEGNFGVTKNDMFRKLFGRYPLSSYDEKKKYFLLTTKEGMSIHCDSMADFWMLCITREAAREAGVDTSQVTPEMVENLSSAKMHELLPIVANVTVLSS